MRKYAQVICPFDVTIRRLYVDVYINGNKYKGLLDTGAQDILVSDHLIKKEGLTLTNQLCLIPKINFDGVNDYIIPNLIARKNNKGFDIEKEGLDIILGVNCMLFSHISIDESFFSFHYPTK